MNEIPAHELDHVRICKEPGCPDLAHYTRTVAAGMCHTHGLAALRAQQARIVELRKQRGTYRGRNGARTGAITDAARDLLDKSKRLDVAIDAVYQAEQRRDIALAQWRDAVNELIRTANAAIPRNPDALRAAIDEQAA